jgi:hypothetical protein
MWIGNYYNPYVGTGREYRSMRRRPEVHVHRDFRGARVRSVDGDHVTLDVQLEAHRPGSRVVSAALFEDELRPAVGMPVIVRVVGDGADDYEVTEVRPGRWPRGSSIPDEAGAVARGEWLTSVLTEAEGVDTGTY